MAVQLLMTIIVTHPLMAACPPMEVHTPTCSKHTMILIYQSPSTNIQIPLWVGTHNVMAMKPVICRDPHTIPNITDATCLSQYRTSKSSS